MTIRDEGSKKMEEAMQALRGGGGGGDAGEIRQKLMAMRKELGDKAIEVLSPEQREQFEKMKGRNSRFPRSEAPSKAFSGKVLGCGLFQCVTRF